jgi:hypothetical protein
MEPHPHWSAFEVRFRDGTRITKRFMSQWGLLERYVLEHALGNIARITCYFDAPHFPYRIHVVILEHIEDHLEMRFHTYYNAQNQQCVIHYDQHYYDYRAVMDGLEGSVLKHYVFPPNQ